MKLDARKTAIVAMDFQPTILATLPPSESLKAHVARAIAATHASGGTVATVRVAFTADELEAFPERSAMGARMRSIAAKVTVDSGDTQVVPDIGADHAAISVRKIRVGPFGTTDLHDRLRSLGIETVAFAGIHTSGCVLTGVREAADLDYRIVILSDACADPDQTAHEVLMTTIFPKQATVLTVADYVQSLEPAA